jgi:hypothetical protein
MKLLRKLLNSDTASLKLHSYIVLTGKMIEMMNWKEMVMTYFEVLSQNLSEKNYKHASAEHVTFDDCGIDICNI